MTFTTSQTREEFGGTPPNHEIPSCEICEGGTYRLPCRACGIRICDICRAGGFTCECHNPWFRLRHRHEMRAIAQVPGILASAGIYIELRVLEEGIFQNGPF